MKRVIRSCVALLLVCAMLLGLPGMSGLMMTAKATEPETGENVSSGDTLKIVSFGDSMTNGYGLEGYALPNGYGVNGFLQESQVAYPWMLADYLGENVDLTQLAVSGMRAEDLLFTLSYDWEQPWETTHTAEDGKVHRYRKMTETEFYEYYASLGYDYQTYHHFIDGKSSDLTSSWEKTYPNAYFCADPACRRTYLGNINAKDICEHFTTYIRNKGYEGTWSGGYGKGQNGSGQEYTWEQITIPKDRGPIYFYSDESHGKTAPLKSNMNGNIWFGNAMAAYAGQFQTAVEDADVITLGVGNANFGVYLLSRMISAMGVLPGFGASDYCWDPTLNDGMGGYDPTKTENFEYSKIKEIVKRENDPLMVAMSDMAEDIIDKNMASFAASMGVTNPDNINAMENILLYSTISFMRSYGMMLDRIAELNPDATVIIVGLMNACSGLEMVMADGSVADLETTFEDLFGLLNTYLTALATMKNANFQLDESQEATADHSNITYLYAEEPTVEVLADVFYEPDQGIYGDNVMRDRFISSVCNQVFYLMRGAMKDANLPGGIELVSVDRDQVESYEAFAVDWAADKTTQLPDGMTTSEMFSCAVYLGFERAIAKAGQTGTLYMSAIEKTKYGFDAIFAPIAGALGEDLVKSENIAEISQLLSADIGRYATRVGEKNALLAAVGEKLAVHGLSDTNNLFAKVAFAIEIENGFASLETLDAQVSQIGKDSFAVAVDQIFIQQLGSEAMMNAVISDWLTDLNKWNAAVASFPGGMPDPESAAFGNFASFAFVIRHDLFSVYETDDVEKALNCYAQDTYAPYYISANITDALYYAVMGSDENPDETFETLLNMFARNVIGDGLGQHPSQGGHVQLFNAIKNTWDNQTTAAEHTELKVGEAANAYAASMDEATAELLANAMYEAAVTGEYATTRNSYYLALSDGKLTGYEAKLAKALYGETASNHHNVICAVKEGDLSSTVRADDLLWALMDAAAENYAPDSYFTNVALPALLEETGCADQTALRAYLAAEITKADLITVSVGPSSLAYAANNTELPDKDQWIAALGEEKAGYALKLFETITNVAGEDKAKMVESLAWCNTTHKVAYPALIDTIRAINPKAQVVLLGYFDGQIKEEQTMEFMGLDLPMGKIYHALNVEGDNIALQYAIDNNETTTFVKVRDDDSETGCGDVALLIQNALEIGHVHDWSNEYRYDENAHWFQCLTPGCEVEDFSNVEGSGYAEHDFTANAYECVCGYVRAIAPTDIEELDDATYTVNQGSAAALTANASVPAGSTLTYQWFSAQDPNEAGTIISGATEVSYTPAIDTIGTTYYYCELTNTYGEGETAVFAKACTNIVAIEVIDVVHAVAPTITTQPAGSGYLDTDTVADALTVAAEVADEGALSYQWYRNTENSTEGGEAIEGATSNSYTPSIAATGTVYYYCVVTNTNETVTGNKTASVTSAVATIVVETAVNAATPVIAVAPEGATHVRDAVAEAMTFTVTTTDSDRGGVVTYQWFLDGEAIEGATSNSYIPATDTVGRYVYTCEITNTNNSVNGIKTATVTSDPIIIVVEEPVDAETPTIKEQPVAPEGVYALNAAAKALTVEAEISDAGTLSYQWYLGETPVEGATNSRFVPATDVVGTFTYKCQVTNTNEAATGAQKVVSVFSDAVTVIVKDIAKDSSSILDGVLALTNVSNPNAGRELTTVLNSLQSEYADHIANTTSGTYYVDDTNLFLALGGTTAAATGNYVGKTADGLEAKGAENSVVFEFVVDNNAKKSQSVLNMASYIESNKSAIEAADIITYQVESSSFAEYMLDAESGVPAWPGKYSKEEALVEGYLDALKTSITNQLNESLDSLVASTAITRVNGIVLPMVERLMYAATVHFEETAQNLAAIRAYNPEALIVVVGMNNPIYGLNQLNITGSINLGFVNIPVEAELDFDFSSLFAQVIKASNMNASLAAMQDTTGNTVYVTLPESSIIAGNLPTSIDVNDALADPPLADFKEEVFAGMVVTAAGQQQITNAIVNAVAVEAAPEEDDEEDDGETGNLEGFAIAYKAASLTLEGDITINYKAQVTEPAGSQVEYTVGSLFWNSKPSSYTIDGNPDLQIEKDGVNGDDYRYETAKDYHVFPYNDVAAKELNDNIYSVVYVRSGDNYVYSEPLTYSVAKCAKTVLSTNSKDSFKRLAVDLLNYGAAAQTYFGYRTNALANASLTDAQKQLGTQNNVSLTSNRDAYGDASDYVAFKSASLLLNNVISMNLKATVNPMEGYEVQSVKMIYDTTFTDLDTWNANRNNMTTVTMNKDGDLYEGTISNIVAKAMRNSYYAQVAVTYVNGAGSTVTEYSQVMKLSVADVAYLVRTGNQETLKPLTEALMKYGDSAKAYFDTIN